MSLGPQFKHNVQSGVRAATTTATTGLLAATMAVGGATHEAPTGGWTGSAVDEHYYNTVITPSKPRNEPTWNRHLSQQFKGFSDMRDRPKDYIASHVVAVDSGNDASRMTFDKAWALNNDNERANNVWTVGYR